MANVTTIYACAQDGLYIFNKPGTAMEWLPGRRVLEGRRVVASWAEPGPPVRLLAAVGVEGDQEAGELLLSENGGRAWETALDAPVTSILGFESDPSRLYVGMAGGGIAASVDGGTSWGVLPGIMQGGSVRHMAQDLLDTQRFFALLEQDGTTSLLVGNPEQGEWQHLAISGPQALAQETGSGDLYAATSDGVQIGPDGGRMWDLLPGSPPEGTAIAAISGPRDTPPTLVVGTASALFLSPGGGDTWQAVDLPQPGGIAAIARDPERRDRLYAATAGGYLFESGNRGQTWEPVNEHPAGAITSLFVLRL
ncbi:MAG: WD40/YVTN/BNR-like repeat-containing protein [Chloroflexia bacterium]